MKKYTVGIIGATGYTGVELVKLLRSHPRIEIAFVTSERHKGKKLKEMFPFLFGSVAALEFISLEEALAVSVDGVFSCLPHKTAVEKLAPFFDQGTSHIVDLSADFRLSSVDLYEFAYCKHERPDLLKESLYGLCEWVGESKTKEYRLIGSPGCYPTSILLPLLPLVEQGVIESTGIIADSKSGASGAGKEPSAGTHFVEVHENFSAYKVGDEHRHLTEINEQLSIVAKKEVNVIFTPHLLPMARGILSTIYVDLKEGMSELEVRKVLLSQYKDSPMIEVLEVGFPKTSWVRGTNRCVIGLKELKGQNKLVIVSVIDNLIKGASGQALQNMNILLDLEPSTGLN